MSEQPFAVSALALSCFKAVSLTAILACAALAPTAALSQSPAPSPESLAQAHAVFECTSTLDDGQAMLDLPVIERMVGMSDYAWIEYNHAPLRIFGFTVLKAVFEAHIDAETYYTETHRATLQANFTSVKQAAERAHGKVCQPDDQGCVIDINQGGFFKPGSLKWWTALSIVPDGAQTQLVCFRGDYEPEFR